MRGVPTGDAKEAGNAGMDRLMAGYRQTPDWVTGHPDLADGAARLFAAIASAVHEHGPKPTHRLISLAGGHGESSSGEKWVRRYLPSLVAAGAVEVSDSGYTVCSGLSRPPPGGTRTRALPVQGHPPRGAEGTRTGVALAPASDSVNTETNTETRDRGKDAREAHGSLFQNLNGNGKDSEPEKTGKRKGKVYPGWFSGWWNSTPGPWDDKAAALKYLKAMEEVFRNRVMAAALQYAAMATANPDAGKWRGVSVFVNSDDVDMEPHAWLDRAKRSGSNNGNGRAPKVGSEFQRPDGDF